MTLRFMDSFDHYATGDLTEKWTANDFCGIAAGQGRRGTASMNQPSWGSFLTLTLDNQPVWVIGWALNIQNLPASVEAPLVQWRDGTTVQVELRVNLTGTLSVLRGTTVLGTTTAVLTTGTYNYLELYALIHPSAGQVTVQLNGVVVLALTSVNTQQTGNAYAQSVRLGNIAPGSGGSTGLMYLDDVYICDGTGSTNKTLLGDCRVDALLPNGDGANSAWTPSTGTTHSTLVDETPPNDDTDYLSTSTVGARDTHAMGNLPAMSTPIILGLQHLVNARKDDAGARQIKSLLKSGATTQVGSTLQTLLTTYTYYRELYPVDPATGAAWTVAGVNAVEAGMEAQ